VESSEADVELLHLPEASSLSGAGRVAWTQDLTEDGLAEILCLQRESDGTGGVYLFDGNPAEGTTQDDALVTFTDAVPGVSNRSFAFKNLDDERGVVVVYGDDENRPVLRVLDPDGVATSDDWNASLLGVEGYSSSVPQALFADVDGDGVEELLLGQMTSDVNNRTQGLWGTVTGSVTVFEVTEEKEFLPRIVYYGHKFLGSMGLAVADANGDGHADLLAGDSGSILEPNSWQILGFTGPINLATSGVQAEVGWQADIRISGGENDRIGAFDVVPDLDGDGAAGLVAYAGESELGPWYIRALEPGHHRISEVGRTTSLDAAGQPVASARGVGDTDGDGSPDAVFQFFDGGSNLVPRLFLGDIQ
jgi:hypothetical protein